MDLTIARLTQGDAEVIGPEHNRIWRAVYPGLVHAERLHALDDAESLRRWRERGREHEEHGCSAQGATTWVAHDRGGRPVGWMGVGPARDPDPPCATELWSLYVVPEFWGAGVAPALLDARLPAGPAYLWVLQGNDRAISFYRKQGFEADGATALFDTAAGPGGGVEVRMVRGPRPVAASPGAESLDPSR